MRLVKPFEFARNQRRNHRTIFRQFVFPPANRQIAAKRLAIIEIGADDGRFKISTGFHNRPCVTSI